MTPQSKLEYIIYLVREYEKDIANQEQRQLDVISTNSARMNTLMVANISTANLNDDPVPSIEPQAQVYLERIEAFLSKE